MAEHREQVLGFSIDPPESRDIDDAIWIEDGLDGHTVLQVHISDVSAVVTPGSEADRQARAMLFTRYYAGGSKPMLPVGLAENTLSLLASKPRATITVMIHLDANYEFVESRIARTLLTSVRKFSYFEADRVILGTDPWEYSEVLQRCNEIAQGRLARRRANGALAIYDLRAGWRTTEEGQIVRIVGKDRHWSNIIIQEFMVLANEAVARWLDGVPGLYRNHAGGPADPVRAELLRAIQDLEGQTIEALEDLHQRTLVAIGRAHYGTKPTGHFGLNLPAYVHFTSPIRRYADLVTHRIVANLRFNDDLVAEDLQALAQRITDREQEIRERRKEGWKRAADQGARAKIEAKRDDLMAKLDPMSFGRVIKIGVRECKLAEPVVAEIERRAASDTLTLVDLYTSLLERSVPADITQVDEAQEAFRARVQTAVLENAKAHPHRAIQLFEIAKQDVGLLYRFMQSVNGEEHTRTFSMQCTVTLAPGRVLEGAVVTASQRKAAKQGAALAALHQIVGRVPPRAAALVACVPPAPKPAPKPVVGVGGDPRNAIGVLNEHCQQKKWNLPDYDFGMPAGEPHQPVFTCTCTVGALIGQGTGTTRKAAKHAAAQALVKQL